MCGIAGIVLGAPGASDSRRNWLAGQLERLATALAHRGPDARATVLCDGAGLAHARLAILDLSATGAQPMWCPERRFLIAFNGEIYNFAALRAELEERGERFSGRSDTEVLLRLIVRSGPGCLSRLDGMFALAVLDTRTNELILARDRAGQKPLYVAELPGGGLAFASEILPLLRIPGVDANLSPEGLGHLLTFGFAPAPFTLRRGIRQLEPGTELRFVPGGALVEKRYGPAPGPAHPPLTGSFEELSRGLEAVLRETVREHLVADVPVGVLLSGGVDSSTIAALAAQETGRIQTFCVVQRDPVYDEREAARTVAEHIGSEHHEISLDEGGLREDDLDVIVDHHGDPFADSSSLNVLRLARETRRHVKVALSGDGGDEVFAGYPRFAQLRAISSLARSPALLLRAAAGACARLPGERARQLARVARIAGMPRPRRMVAFTTLFWPEEQARLLRGDWLASGAGGRLDALLESRGASLELDPVASAHWLEQSLHLPDDMLAKVDRMSMVSALEVRPPLLGQRVLDYAERLPFAVKNQAGEAKRILKSVARRLVPAQVIDRPKGGFGLPLLDHGGAVLDDATRFALESTASPLRALFRADALRALAAELRPETRSRDPEDSQYRRTHRRWLLVLLARTLARHGGV